MGANVIEFPRDMVENCRHEIQQGRLKNYRKKIGAELILKDGTRRYFRCKSVEKEAATREVLTFVEAVERATGDSVMWRFKGQTTYQMSSNLPVSYSRKGKMKGKVKSFFNYFFDLED